jgi:hypothetical protein
MGYLGAIGLGFVIGPAVGVGLEKLGLGFKGAAFAAAGLAILNAVWAFFKLTEPAGHRVSGGEDSALTVLARAVKRPDLRRALFATLV